MSCFTYLNADYKISHPLSVVTRVLVKVEMRQLLVGSAQLERCIADLRTTMCHYSSEVDLGDRMADYDERDDYDDHTTAASRLEAPSTSVPVFDSSVDDDGPWIHTSLAKHNAMMDAT